MGSTITNILAYTAMKNRGVVPVRKSLTEFEEPSFSGKYLHCASAGSHWLMERMALQAASPKSSTPTHFFGVLLRASILGVFWASHLAWTLAPEERLIAPHEV